MKRPQMKLAAIVGGVALTLLVAFTALNGGGPASALAAAAATPGASAAPGKADNTNFLSKLAANLGIGQDTLTAAVKTTNLQLIDEAVAAGTMTEAQAQAARDRINNSTDGGMIFGGGGKRGGEGRGGFDGATLNTAMATYFGISADQLKQDLAATGSVQGVAAKYGKDTDAGKAGLKAALETALRQDLTTKGIATAQIDQVVNQFSQNFDQFYTQAGGGHGPRGPQMPQPSASPAAGQ